MKFTFIILFIVLTISAQDYFPALTESDFGNFKILKEKEFDGNSLWGHINGGADLYLEYGFDKLLYQDVEYNGIRFRVEFYRMQDEKSAYGIFSINRFRCNKTDTLTKFICITENQIQSALGRFYISISNEKETKEALLLSYQLLKKILPRSEEKTFEIPSVFEKENLKSFTGNLKFLKGELGFQNGFPQWESLFSGLSNYSLFILPIENDSGYFNLAEIEFSNETDLQSFLSSINITKLKIGESKVISIDEQEAEVQRLSIVKLLYLESDYKTELLK